MPAACRPLAPGRRHFGRPNGFSSPHSPRLRPPELAVESVAACASTDSPHTDSCADTSGELSSQGSQFQGTLKLRREVELEVWVKRGVDF